MGKEADLEIVAEYEQPMDIDCAAIDELKTIENDIPVSKDADIDFTSKEDESEWEYEEEENNHIVHTVTDNANFAEEEVTDKDVENSEDDTINIDNAANGIEEGKIDVDKNEESLDFKTCNEAIKSENDNENDVTIEDAEVEAQEKPPTLSSQMSCPVMSESTP